MRGQKNPWKVLGGGGGVDVESRMDDAMYYYVSHPLVFLLSTIAREDDKIKF